MSIPNSGAVVGLIGLPGSIPFLLSQVTIKVLDNEGHLVRKLYQISKACIFTSNSSWLLYFIV